MFGYDFNFEEGKLIGTVLITENRDKFCYALVKCCS